MRNSSALLALLATAVVCATANKPQARYGHLRGGARPLTDSSRIRIKRTLTYQPALGQLVASSGPAAPVPSGLFAARSVQGYLLMLTRMFQQSNRNLLGLLLVYMAKDLGAPPPSPGSTTLTATISTAPHLHHPCRHPHESHHTRLRPRSHPRHRRRRLHPPHLRPAATVPPPPSPPPSRRHRPAATVARLRYVGEGQPALRHRRGLPLHAGRAAVSVATVMIAIASRPMVSTNWAIAVGLPHLQVPGGTHTLPGGRVAPHRACSHCGLHPSTLTLILTPTQVPGGALADKLGAKNVMTATL